MRPDLQVIDGVFTVRTQQSDDALEAELNMNKCQMSFFISGETESVNQALSGVEVTRRE